MTLKGDAMFKGKLTTDVNNDFRNLINFHASSHMKSSEHFHFYGILLPKTYKVLDEKVQKSYVS